MESLSTIIQYIEQIAPLALQESYDNAGLIVGNVHNKVAKALVTIDITEEVMLEAIEMGANLIIAHHPIVFSGLKKITGQSYIERCVILAIKHDIAIYAAHTNLDSLLLNGVNAKIAQKLNLTNLKILSPAKAMLKKLVVYVPQQYADKVRTAMFNSGAGQIGSYSHCSFNGAGTGTFLAGEQAKPFVGEQGKLHHEPEMRVEVVVPAYLVNQVISQMTAVHPYEEPAYDIVALENPWPQIGSGLVGQLETEVPVIDFLNNVKTIFQCHTIRYTHQGPLMVKKIALCGGSGSFLLNDAIRAGAQLFLTSDVKYHQFFDTNNRIVFADMGHFESEQFTKEIFYELLMNKFSTFAVHLSKVNTNPIKYV